MAIDTRIPLSPGWWLERLMLQLAQVGPRYQLMHDYLHNEIVIKGLSLTMTDAYRRLSAMSRTNFAELVVDAPRERMLINGFQAGADADVEDDRKAWDIWQKNSLDADSPMLHRDMLGLGQGYVIVGPVDEEIGAPLITIEDPRYCIAEMDPRISRKPIAALKVYADTVSGVDIAYLYLPGEIHMAVKPRSSSWLASGEKPTLSSGWQTFNKVQELPFPQIPVVSFCNRKSSDGDGRAEFEDHLPILDRINFQIMTRLEIATFLAFRQRAVSGLPSEDYQGNKIDYSDIFKADPGAVWTLPEDAKLVDLAPSDIMGIKEAISSDVRDLAAVTRTPLYYLTPENSNGSAEGAALAREGLIFKTRDRIANAGESWERVMRLAFLQAGDKERAGRSDFQIVWADPERFSLAERYDAASKATAAGVPWRSVMSSVLQFSPQDINRMEAERVNDSLIATAPTSPAPGPPTAQAPVVPAAPAVDPGAIEEEI